MRFGIRSIMPQVVAVAIACAGLGLAATSGPAQAAPLAVPALASAEGGDLVESVVHRRWHHRHHRRHHRHHRRYQHHHGHGHHWHHRPHHHDHHYHTRSRRWH